MIRAILLLVVAACATTHHAEQTTETAKTLDQASSAQTEKDREKQTQSTVAKRVEEGAKWEADFIFAPIDSTTAPAPTVGSVAPVGSDLSRPPPDKNDALPPHGALLKAHFSGQGPTIAELAAAATSQSQGHQVATGTADLHAGEKAKAKGTDDSTFKPAGIFGGLLALWPIWLIALLIGAAIVGWRLFKSRLAKLPLP